jgi:hypothetical protein
MDINPSTKKIFLGPLFFVIAVIVGYGVQMISRSNNVLPTPQEPTPQERTNIKTSTTSTPSQASSTVSTSTNSQIRLTSKKGGLIKVDWATPTSAPTPHIFRKAQGSSYNPETGAEFYNVGKVSSGSYAGGEVLYAEIPSEEIGYNTYRFIVQNGEITYIAKNSNELSEYDYLDRSKILVDTMSSFPDIILPEVITYMNLSFTVTSSNLFNQPQFFDDVYKPSDLKLVFTDPKVGKVYTDSPSEKTTVGSFKINNFYVKAPDGTLWAYSLDINFYDKDHHLPSVVWDDGTTNTKEYTPADMGGCGSLNGLSVQYGLTLADLTPVGATSKGDAVYELKDSNNPILKGIYTNDYNPSGGVKISYTEFVKAHPAFFWLDPFGRIIKFQRYDFIPVAECGKPVIYLYPEQTTNVSVSVIPQGGMTKSIPDYKNGWDVVASPSGIIKDPRTGLEYPYLFWEGRGGLYQTPAKGFVVAEKNVHNFLVEKLTALGLNEKERNDFLDFWEPKMSGSPYFFVTFLGNKEMDQLAPLNITPKPGTIIRILMDFVPLQETIPVEGYSIRTPERKGFTVVEWGGVLR